MSTKPGEAHSQGRKLHDRSELFSAIRAVVEKVSPGRPCPDLTDREWARLAAIRISQESSLEVLFEPSAPFVQDDFAPGLRSLRRLGVKNLTDRTLDGVEILLSDFQPQGAPFLPVHLRLMHNIPQPFQLHPGETQYADLVWYEAMGEHPHHLVLCYSRDDVPKMIPLGQYRLTVKARARDVKARERTFTVDVDEEGRLLLSSDAPKAAPKDAGTATAGGRGDTGHSRKTKRPRGTGKNTGRRRKGAKDRKPTRRRRTTKR